MQESYHMTSPNEAFDFSDETPPDPHGRASDAASSVALVELPPATGRGKFIDSIEDFLPKEGCDGR